MLTPQEFEAALDNYLASDAPPSSLQAVLLQPWIKQLGQQELSPLSEDELAATRCKMWARIQALTDATDEPSATS